MVSLKYNLNRKLFEFKAVFLFFVSLESVGEKIGLTGDERLTRHTLTYFD